MTDGVDYQLPFGPLGTLVHAAVVRRRLDPNVAFRSRKSRRAVRRHDGPAGAASRLKSRGAVRWWFAQAGTMPAHSRALRR